MMRISPTQPPKSTATPPALLSLWGAFLLLLLALCPSPLQAQRERTTLFGLGRANDYDTYLSPLEYTGPQVSFLHLTERTLRRTPHLRFHTATQIDFARTQNTSRSAYDLGGKFRFDAGWLRAWSDVLPRLTLAAGGQMGSTLGVLYNSRNGNNPANARANAQLSALLAARYGLPLGRRTLTLDYRLSIPLLGAMFSPQYGQSYYNLFEQGNYDHNILLTHPGNALSLRQNVLVSFPLRKQTLTLGYQNDLIQAKPHNLRQHHYAHSLLIGWRITP